MAENLKSQPGARYLTVDYSTNPSKILEDFDFPSDSVTKGLTEQEFRARMTAVNQTTKEVCMAENNGSGISYNIGNTIVNLTGTNVDELAKENEKFKTTLLDEIGETMVLIKQMEFAKELRGAPVVSAPTNVNRQNAAPTAGSPTCDHGSMKDMNGKPKQGGGPRTFRWTCPAPFGQGCDFNALKAHPQQEKWSA